METPLQNAKLSAGDLTAAILPDYEEEDDSAEEEQSIHLPGPSLWPLILSASVVVTVIGVLFLQTAPGITIVGAVFALFGILGWGLEDPHGGSGHSTYISGESHSVLEQAEAIVERVVTIGSTAWSAHPVSVEVEQEEAEGVVLALYGKVELEAQRDRLEEELLKLPNVISVKNFVVAEDAILNGAYARIEELKASGKLDGATNLNLFVENYVVNLYGEVPTNAMKYMLENELIALPGVRVVVNHIGLNEEIPGNLGRTKNKVGK